MFDLGIKSNKVLPPYFVFESIQIVVERDTRVGNRNYMNKGRVRRKIIND